MLVCDLDQKQKFSVVILMPCTGQTAIYSVFLVAFVPPTPSPVGFLEIATNVREYTHV